MNANGTSCRDLTNRDDAEQMPMTRYARFIDGFNECEIDSIAGWW